jgi:hypothetical protein
MGPRGHLNLNLNLNLNGPFRRCSACAEWESRRGSGRWYGGGDSGRAQGARDRHAHGLRLQKRKVWAAAIQVRGPVLQGRLTNGYNI